MTRLVPTSVFSSANRDRSVQEIDLAPAERLDLAASHSLNSFPIERHGSSRNQFRGQWCQCVAWKPLQCQWRPVLRLCVCASPELKLALLGQLRYCNCDRRLQHQWGLHFERQSQRSNCTVLGRDKRSSAVFCARSKRRGRIVSVRVIPLCLTAGSSAITTVSTPGTGTGA
jgi:hypothetical protein